MSTPASLTLKLQETFPDAVLKVEDLSDGCGAKFYIMVVTPQFDSVPIVERHRMVHAAIEAEMKDIHAVELKTWTPAQHATRMKKEAEQNAAE